MNAAQQFGNLRVAAAGDVALAYLVKRQAAVELAGAADFQPILEHGHLHEIRIAPVAVAEGVDQCFADGFERDLGHVHAAQAFQPHADVDVFQRVFFGFFDQFKNVAIEIVTVDDGGAGVRSKYRAAQLDGCVGKKQFGGVDGRALTQQVELFQGVGGAVWRQVGARKEAADLFGVQLFQRQAAGFTFPAQRILIVLQDEVLQFAGAEFFVFIRHPHVRTTIGEIRLLPALGLDVQAMLAVDALLGDVWIDDRFDMGSNGLGNITQGLFVDLQAHGFAVGCNAEP